MFLLRRLFRWSFFGQAIFFGGLSYRILAQQNRTDDFHAIVANFLLPVGSFVLASIFGMAWYTTRKVSNTPQGWAITASAVHLTSRLVILIIHTHSGHPETLSLANKVTPFIDLGGIFFYSRGAWAARTARRRAQALEAAFDTLTGSLVAKKAGARKSPYAGGLITDLRARAAQRRAEAALPSVAPALPTEQATTGRLFSAIETDVLKTSVGARPELLEPRFRPPLLSAPNRLTLPPAWYAINEPEPEAPR